MGIYIKGLQMPKGEFESLDLSIDSDGKVYIDERDWFGQHTYKLAGEAVSISDHGDLIDRDAMAKDLDYDVEMDNKALDDTDIVGIERKRLLFDKACKQNCIYYFTEQEAIIPAERSE